MEHGSVRGEGTHSQWHVSQMMTSAVRLLCVCGAIVYTGPKPNFSRVSCPKCKKVHDVPKEMRK